MLKYKLKDTPVKSFSFNYVRDYLETLGIKSTESFIKGPKIEDEETYKNLDRIEEACRELYLGFKNNKKFFLQVDSDADGYTSSAIFYAFFKRLFPEAKIEWRVHDGKEHGIILDTVPISADYIIIPDAGSVQFDEQKELSAKGYKVIIIDHHNISPNYERYENVIIVNNQSSVNFKNKSLSGAGVVYKTIQAFNNYYKDEFPMIYEDYADLAAIGIVADMMDTRELDNNFIIHKGRNNIVNPMLKALIKKQSFSISNEDCPNKIDIAFYIAPIINAVIRFGMEEEKNQLFEGFIDYFSEEKQIITQYRGNERVEQYYDYIARISFNVRGKQNREKEKNMNFLIEKIEKENLDKHQLIAVKISKDEVSIPHTITGLVAMELLKKYKKPVLVLRPKSDGNGGTIYAGSGRGKANGDFDSLYRMLRESKLCEFVEGHDMAHGVAIHEKNFDKVIDFANEYLKEIEFDVEEYEVDYIFNNNNLNLDMIYQFGKYIDLYGNSIPQPKFAFELNVAKTAVSFLKDGKTLKISLNGMEYIKFHAKSIIEEMESFDAMMYKIKIVGRAQLNH